MSNLDVSVILRLVDRLSQPARRASRALGLMERDTKGLGQAADRAGAKVDRLGRDTERAAQRAQRAATRFANMRRSLESLGMSSLVLGPLQQTGDRILNAMKKPIGASRDFEDRLIAFGNTAGVVGPALKAIEDRLDGISKVTNRPTGDLLGALEGLVAKGLPLETALKALEAVGRGATATKAEVDDIGAASFAALDNLKVPVDQLNMALDAMAQSGKAGGFELKNMAKEFPKLTASASKLKMQGVPAVADLSAALQVALKGAGSPDEAANNMQNFLSKITSPEVVKNFKKFGVNVEKEMKKAEKAGTSPIEHMLGIIEKKTKGNPFKVGQIFGDQQVMNFITPMLANMEEYRRIRAEALGAKGVIDADYARQTQSFAAATERLASAWDRVMRTMGDGINPVLGRLADRLADVLDGINGILEKYPLFAAGLGGFALLIGGLAAAAGSIGSAVVAFAAFAIVTKHLLGFVPGARLLGGAFRGVARGVGGIARGFGLLMRFGGGLISGFFSGLASGASGALAQVGGLSTAVGGLSSRLKGLMNLRNALRIGGALAIGSEMISDLGMTPDERIAKLQSRAQSWGNLERDLDNSSFGQFFRNMQNRARGAVGLSPVAPQGMAEVAQEIDASRTTNQQVSVTNNVTVNATTNASPGSIAGAIVGAAANGTRQGLSGLHDGGAAGSTYGGAP